MIRIFAVILYFLAAQVIAKYIGEKRQIGYGKSIFWCLVLTPILGIIIVLMSDKKEE